jgi:hypothetical protein
VVVRTHLRVSECGRVAPRSRLHQQPRPAPRRHPRAAGRAARARDQGIEVGAGELPFERLGDALEVALEVGQALGHRLEAREVIRRERLALHDREVDLDLVEPAGVDRAVHRDDARMRLRQALHRCLASMRRAVVHDPEDAACAVVGWLAHDLIDQPCKRGDTRARFAASEHLGAVHVQRRQIGPGAATPILVLHAHWPAGFGW